MPSFDSILDTTSPSRVAARLDLPPRDAAISPLAAPLHQLLTTGLDGLGIHTLYRHQAQAIDAIRDGQHVVIVTGTSSGKTLCYTLPILQAWLADQTTTALFIYPTKALAQDQLRALTRWQEGPAQLDIIAGTYDGDTTPYHRRRLRQDASLILTNPDMLHQGILPQHARWQTYLAGLRYIVIDELHAYRGVFGSHLANVLRRLRRLCNHYGSDPQFICTSATIGNPADHATRLTGTPITPIDADGAPAGPRQLLFWNPPLVEAPTDPTQGTIGGHRGSPFNEAVNILTTLVKRDTQTIAFVRTRLASELITRQLRQRLGPDRAHLVQAYRGGYLPEQRRDIEAKLASRQVMAVISTNALELGIDIGTLDACVIIGYPGSVASFRQQAGRAGRGTAEALVVMIADSSPMDQYLLRHPNFLVDQNPEIAVTDPDNPHIVVGHLKCAAHEIPLTEPDLQTFGAYSNILIDILTEDEVVRRYGDNYYWASSDFPAADVSLRNIPGPTIAIKDHAQQTIGTIDQLTALAQLHPGAVYLHGAETYLVDRLDLDDGTAHVHHAQVDYYTTTVQANQIAIDEVESQTDYRGGILGFGDVTVTTTIPMYRKVRFEGRQNLGFEPLDLPDQVLETVGLWWVPPADTTREFLRHQLVLDEALLGIANVFLELVPFFLMCDPRDVGTVIDTRSHGHPALFFHDRYPGGMGFAERALHQFDAIITAIAEVIAQCPCRQGCPSCVGSSVSYTPTERDNNNRPRLPSKTAALRLLKG